MSADAVVMAVLCYGLYVGGFIAGMIKIVRSDQK